MPFKREMRKNSKRSPGLSGPADESGGTVVAMVAPPARVPDRPGTGVDQVADGRFIWHEVGVDDTYGSRTASVRNV